MECELVGPPEPTSWFCVELTVLVTPPGARVIVSLGWAGDLALSPDDVGLAHANVALRWVDSFRRTHRIAMHLLLREAKRKSDSEGTLDESESLPAVAISAPPKVDEGLLVFELDVDGERTTGRLSPTLEWSCPARPARIWGAARFAAMDFALDRRVELASQGFVIRSGEE